VLFIIGENNGFKILKPTKQVINSSKIFGFDIETYDNNKKFYCASIYGGTPRTNQTFFSKDELIEHFKLKRFGNSIVVASNLSFDFFGTLFKKEDIFNFKLLFQGSNLIWARTYLKGGKFFKKYSKNREKVVFLDTLNYAKMSVEQLGKLSGCRKLETPSFIGRKPQNKAEKEEMVKYNMQDAKVSKKGLEFLYDAFYKMGSSQRTTIASTSMSIFKNKYLNDEYFRQPVWILDKILEGYYGGRTEAFSRGRIKDYYYYDINSLYPSVMRDYNYPNPNTCRWNRKNTTDYIHQFDGMSKVTLSVYPDSNSFVPYMPFRGESKLIFPVGKFTGWYTHFEIRKAIDYGYNILKVHETFYYKENCSPFKGFVDDLYSLRKKLKAENNKMEYVVKIVMNSLYGKFAQGFRNKDNLIPFDHTLEELNKLDHFEVMGDFIRVKKEFQSPANFCIPIWASHVTAYARDRLYNYLKISDPVYCDTDSIITKKKFPESNELGMLKLEHYIEDGIIVKPKMYAIKNQLAKVKGVAKKFTFDGFITMLRNPEIHMHKFCKPREAIRRGFTPNEIIEITKSLSLEDDKRFWGKEFDFESLYHSSPLIIDEGVIRNTPKVSLGFSPLISR